MILLILLVTSVFGNANRHIEVLVDLIEVNHVNSDSSCFDQVVVWVWTPAYRRHDVIAWWIMSSNYASPRKIGDAWVAEKDLGSNCFRFRSKVFIQTWTNYDRERANQEFRPEKYRLRLGGSQRFERSTGTHSSEN